MNRKRLLLALKLTVSLALLWMIYRRVPFDAVSRSVTDIDLRYLPLILGILLCNTVLSAWKWQIILRADDVHVSLRRLVVSYLIGTFFNIFLPSSIGGDAYRIYDVARDCGRSASSFSAVLADRLSGFLALALVAVAASVAAARMASTPFLSVIPIAALAVLGFMVWALFRQTPVRRAMALLRLNRIARLDGFADQCLASFDRYRRNTRVAIRIMGISFLFQFLLVTCVALMAEALGIRVPFVYYCAFVPMICLMEALPISVYGVGIRDAGYVFFFGLIGVPRVAALSLALTYLGTNVAYSLFGGIVFAGRLFFGNKGGRTTLPTPTRARRVGLAALVTLAVWIVFSWPLPLHVASGIPFSSRSTETHQVRDMVSGDHLQLMYHFWLAGDMLRGKTPWMHNLYEFNTGDDAERREPGAYYLPFSLVYAIVSWVGTRALGWNAAGLLSLMITYFFTWRLVRRYVTGEWIAALAALVSVTLPYRWITLLGGSPTGFAMSLVPVLLLGLDVAVRDERPMGGLMAGAAVLLAFCSDLHVFFFGVLLIPCWCIVAFAARNRFDWGKPAAYGRLALALAPAAILALVAYALSRATARELDAAVMAEGWTLRELIRYSPMRKGLVRWSSLGISNQVFVGYVIATILAVGGVLALARRGCDRSYRLVLLLLGVGVAGIVMLALGTHGPRGGKALVVCRKLILPYRMVRQTAKVFSILPPILAVATGIALGAIAGKKRTKWRQASVVGLCLLLLFEFRMQLSASICRLDRAQPAYEAVAEDARASEGVPRVLVLPLWPGNSHWSSVYQHYVSLYRIRMLNGYKPGVPKAYVQSIFKVFESTNQGLVTDEQLDDLKRRSTGYVLLHEDAFPEQVSPFPVNLTLKRLLNHPRLQLLHQHQRVWAFKILPAPVERPPVAESWQQLMPAWRWEMERAVASNVTVSADAAASGGHSLVLDGTPGNTARIATRAPVAGANAMRWMLLAKGNGRLRFHSGVDDDVPAQGSLNVDSRAWHWIRIPIESDRAFFTPWLTLSVDNGDVTLDTAVLAAGPDPAWGEGETVTIPAPCLFHAGYTDLASDRVAFLIDKEPARVILYGLILAPDAGRYEATLELTAKAAPAARPVGTWRAVGTGGTLGETEVAAGETAHVAFTLEQATPVRLEFEYTRSADVNVGDLILRRKKR